MKTILKLPIILGTAMVLLVASGTLSQVLAGGDKDHSGGFFLRLSAGGGSAETKVEGAGGFFKFSGGGADFNIAIGAMISPNLAIHGTFFGWFVSGPDLEFSLLDSTGTVSTDGDVNMSVVGGGLTYYIMPANIYLSGSIGVSGLSFDGDIESFSEGVGSGFAIDTTIGKEWWVGNSWGLGAAGFFGYHSIKDDFLDLNWKGPSFGLRFTATMN